MAVEIPEGIETMIMGIVDQLPDRTADNSREAVEEEFAQLDKKLIKKKAWLKRRHELYTWSKRAELVGIAPLPPRRPTIGQRLAWEESIVKAEEESMGGNNLFTLGGYHTKFVGIGTTKGVGAYEI